MTEIPYNPKDIVSQFDKNNKLPLYFDLLLRENKKINLVSRETTLGGLSAEGGSTAEGNLFQLAAESLLPLTTISIGDDITYLDIGSGGGFPSIPIIITQNISQATLVERTQKKAGALRRMLMALNKKVDIHPVSFENYKAEKESFDLITLRLVKLTKPMLSEILSLLSPNGTFIYYSKTELDVDNSIFQKRSFTYSSGKGSNATYVTFKR